MTGYEQQLLARARELADVSELRAETLELLGAARRAGLDPGATSGLTGAGLALGAAGHHTWSAGRSPGRTYPDETAFIGALTDLDDEITAVLTAASRLHDQLIAALGTALDDQDTARIAACETAISILTTLASRLRHARGRLCAVPADLGETYESVYQLIRAGGRMPRDGRWIDGGRTA